LKNLSIASSPSLQPISSSVQQRLPSYLRLTSGFSSARRLPGQVQMRISEVYRGHGGQGRLELRLLHEQFEVELSVDRFRK
jgi:hypothetical protein